MVFMTVVVGWVCLGYCCGRASCGWCFRWFCAVRVGFVVLCCGAWFCGLVVFGGLPASLVWLWGWYNIGF